MIQSENTHLAQINAATALDDVDSPKLADFAAALDRINAVAERSPGFVWRYQDETGNAANIRVTGNPRFIVNMSVRESPGHLGQFVWNTVHKRLCGKKAKWFETRDEACFVMWRIPAGHTPAAAEGLERPADLNANGPGERVFGWESLPDVKLWMERRCAWTGICVNSRRRGAEEAVRRGRAFVPDKCRITCSSECKFDIQTRKSE